MSQPGPEALFAALEATWPPLATRRLGPWTIRDGGGGGKRVSAATAEGPVTTDDIAEAEAAMRALGQTPLVMIRDGEAGLDGLLAAHGYAVLDPVVFYGAPAAQIAATPPDRVSTFAIWEPLAVMQDLWTASGIGPARQAVMARVRGPKTALLGRVQDRPAGVAFVALHDGIAMIHALEVDPDRRRSGLARNMMRGAAAWARDAGASYLALAVTRENGPANRLYASLGMGVVGQYHYRSHE